MIPNFAAFAAALAVHFAHMAKNELYRVAVDGDLLWNMYLDSFPVGTNEIYRTRRYYDGSYDRHFVRRMGNVVNINADGTLTTIWDLHNLEFPFNVVCEQLSAFVKAAALDTLFRTKESSFGFVSTIERLEDGNTKQWDHFHCKIEARHKTAEPNEVVGEFNTSIGVIKRGFNEITPDAVTAVLDLIHNNLLYRGPEFATALRGFQASQNKYLAATRDHERDAIVFQAYGSAGSRLRNSAIGTLLQDLSNGESFEKAVQSFERMVAPTNYKRPTALITPGMINQAVETLKTLDLESALERRHATLNDLSVHNVLWVNNSAQGKMRDGLTSLLMTEVQHVLASTAAQPISVDDFMTKVMPQATSMEAFMGNLQQPHLMSITAPVHADAGRLFKWGNNFGWSYNGNITDSIKERVKAAGGNVAADLRVSLAWYNFDDLDLHAFSPDGHVYYGNKAGNIRNGIGPNILDVDMNAGSGTSRTPVENLSWIKPKNGSYKIQVNQFSKRETENVGFMLELAWGNVVEQYSYTSALPNDKTIVCLEFAVRDGVVNNLVVDKSLKNQGLSQQVWGLTTEQFVKVETVLNSPNHWDGECTGNKHWFFILEGCRTEEPTRGIYNEFLKPELETHRKVFEVLGNKTKCLPTAEQLSGLGFSSTQHDSLTVRVTNPTSTRIYQIQF